MSTMQKLRAVAITAHQKIVKNRFKDQQVGGKWQGQAHDAEGGRTWLNATAEFLGGKLLEECRELILAANDVGLTPQAVLDEAGDTCAMAMMVADRSLLMDNLPIAPKVVCLCGSTKFPDAFKKANFRETMAGNIVLSVGFFAHTDSSYVLSDEEKTALDVLHKRKIDLADEILVLNVDGYIGDSTRSEILHAINTEKTVRYLVQG